MGWNPFKAFSAAPAAKVTSQDRAVLDLKLQRDKIRQYQKRLTGVVQKEHDLAKQCLAAGDKQKALLLLRKKKFQESLLQKTDQQLATLEELASNIEFALVQKDVMYGLEQGSRVLKEINKEMSLERVERIMDESADGIAYQREVTDMLSERITSADEYEVQEEFERLEREAAGKEPATKLPGLPKVPQHDLPSAEAAKAAAVEAEPETEERELVAA